MLGVDWWWSLKNSKAEFRQFAAPPHPKFDQNRLFNMSRRGFGGRGRGRGGRTSFGGFEFSALGTTYQEVMSQPRDPDEAYPVGATAVQAIFLRQRPP